MKICIIPPDKTAPLVNHISSGQERVARDQAILLAELGYTVDYWTVKTNEDLSPLGFNHKIIPDVYPRDYFNSNRPNPQRKPKRKWCYLNFDAYDIFLCHTDSSVFLKELSAAGAGKRIISFIHAPFAGTTWGIGFNSGQGRAKYNGATIVTVSEKCKSHWNEWHVSTRKRLKENKLTNISRPDLLNLELVHDNFITEIVCPQYSVLDTPVQPIMHEGIVLSRIAPEKKIHTAFETDTTFVLKTDNKTYYEKICDKLLKENIYINYSYGECMDILSKHKYLISTWPDEMFGLNAFEAAERGISSIICENSIGHASKQFLPDDAYIICESNKKSIANAISRIPKDWNRMKFRQDLANHMRRTYTQNKYIKVIDSLVKKVAKHNPIIKSPIIII